jgi:hypothetical protein
MRGIPSLGGRIAIHVPSERTASASEGDVFKIELLSIISLQHPLVKLASERASMPISSFHAGSAIGMALKFSSLLGSRGVSSLKPPCHLSSENKAHFCRAAASFALHPAALAADNVIGC